MEKTKELELKRIEMIDDFEEYYIDFESVHQLVYYLAERNSKYNRLISLLNSLEFINIVYKKDEKLLSSHRELFNTFYKYLLDNCTKEEYVKTYIFNQRVVSKKTKEN